MVKSGLVDDPDVSPYRLAAHLILAFIIFALMVWKWLDSYLNKVKINRQSFSNNSIRLIFIFLGLYTFQVMYGAFVAGLKAGYVSDTFPLMFGFLFPPNLFNPEISILMNAFSNSVTIHFIHRWFAFVVLGFAVYVYLKMKKENGYAFLLPLVVLVQIILGLFVIWYHVPLSMALIHQLGGLAILSVCIYLLHRLSMNKEQ